MAFRRIVIASLLIAGFLQFRLSSGQQMDSDGSEEPEGDAAALAAPPPPSGSEPIVLHETYARQNVREDLTPYGVDLLGEQFDLATGTLSFNQTDVILPGNSGLEVGIRRYLNTAQRYFQPVNEFGDWGLDIPRMEMMVAGLNAWKSNRCTTASDPGPAVKNGTTFESYEYWNGLKMTIPGHGTQTVLDAPREPKQSNTQKTTTGYWVISCIPASSGEGFLARSPDGIIYRFTMLRYLQAEPVMKGTVLDRRRAQMLVTRIEDRFGNWVNYNYSGGRLTSITSSDTRTITLTYVSGTNRVNTISANGRTWTYGYTVYTGYQHHFLTSVTLPSQQSWTFDLHALVVARMYDGLKLHCGGSRIAAGSITHPYGAKGTYTITETAHGRTNVPKQVILNPGQGDCSGEAYYIQRSFDVMSLTQKKLTGPGLPTMTWNYTYSENQGGWQGDGTSAIKTTTVNKPDGSRDVYHFNRSWSYLEGALVKQQTYNATGTLAQTINYTYQAGPLRGGIGELFYENLAPMTTPRHQRKVTTTRGTDAYHTENTYDNVTTSSTFSFGHPIQIAQWNSFSSHARTENVAYLHDRTHWELGRPTTVTVGSEIESQTIYDANNRPQTIKSFGATTTTLGFYSNGTLNWHKDANGNQTTFSSYYRGKPRTITYADGKTSTLVIDYFGNVTRATDRKGQSTDYAYDSADRLTLINYPDETGSTRLNKTLVYAKVTSTDINQSGSGLVTGQWKQSKTRGTYRETRYLDALLRPVLVKTEDTADSSLKRFTRSTFDSASRPVFQSFPSGSAAASTGTATSYDGLGRVLTVEENVSPYATTTYAYLSSNQIRVTNPRGKQTTTTYFALGAPDTSLPTLISQPLSVTTTINRNDFGEMSSVTQSGGGVSATRTYRYDSRHYMCRQIDPETGSTAYSYDNGGRLQWHAEAASGATGACNLSSVPSGQRVVHSYDNLNRLILVNYPDSSPDVTYGYDDNGNLTSLDSTSANWTYTYNKINAIETESLVTGGQTIGVSYDHDTQDRLTKITYPTGQQVVITPNAYGAPKAVGSYASAIGYHENGSIEALTYGNGWTYTKSQNARQLPYDLKLMSGTTTISNLRHLYDPNTNFTQITDYVTSAATRTMTYDDLDRLGTASGLWGAGSYTYDGLGNIKTKTEAGETMTYNYDTVVNRLTSITGAHPMTLGYDAYGNVTSNGAQGFTYNRAGNLTSSTSPAITYQYDGHKRRVQRSEASQITYTMYSKDGRLLHKMAGGAATDYIYAGSMLIATKQGSTINYVHTDLLGSPINGKAGSTSYTENYTPWGEKLDSPIPLAGDLGYTGHQSDVATGLTYMQARYYDPVLGRFMAVDPVPFTAENPTTFNRYTYANGNPYKFVDRDGREAGITFKILNELANGGKPIVSPPPSPDDWLGPAIGVALGAVIAAPVAAELGFAAFANPGAVATATEFVAGASGVTGAASVAARGPGIVASNGTRITGLTRHGVNRAIGDGAERAGTRPRAILEAFKDPKRTVEGVDSQGRPFQIFHGTNARVVVNPQTGQIVSTNPLSAAGAL